MPTAQTPARPKGLQRFPCKVTKVDRASEDLVYLHFDPQETWDFDFIPGQFTYVWLPDSDHKKPYSIASAPHETDRIELCVKMVENGPVSTYLYNLNEGDDVLVSKALGGFKFKTPEKVPAVFLCTGTGIAPFRSMLLDLLRRKDDRRFWMFLGSAYARNLPYRDEMEALAADNTNVTFIPTVSREGIDWHGERGWVQEAFLRHMLARKGFEAYVCGIKRMVDDILGLLEEEIGLEKKAIHLERYV